MRANQCPLLAQSGHPKLHRTCPLLGVKRTCNAADVPPRPANAYTVQFVSYHKSMNEIDWNEKVKEALDRTEFMAISTIGADGSWTCPVQFGFSEKLDLYFRSMPHSKH